MSEEITYFRFMSEVRAFLAKLLKSPIDAQPSKYLKNRGVTRKWLVDNLIKKDVLERHEKILDPTNSDEKKAKYVVKFKVKKKNFERKIYKLYVKKFESNLNEEAELRSCANLIGVVGGGKPGETADRWARYVNGNDNGFKRQMFKDEDEMKEKILNGPDGDVYKKRGGINEEGEGGGAIGGATGCDSVGSETSRGDVGFDVPFGVMERRPIGGRPKEKNDNGNKPENILGKTLVAEKKSRRIYVTEEQLKAILSEELGGATTTATVAQGTDNGMLGYPRPDKQFKGSNGKKGDKFWGPAMERKPGFSMKRIKGDK